jgi:hypothetical protein
MGVGAHLGGEEERLRRLQSGDHSQFHALALLFSLESCPPLLFLSDFGFRFFILFLLFALFVSLKQNKIRRRRAERKKIDLQGAGTGT